MKYSFDANAWIQIFQCPEIYGNLLAAFSAGEIEVVLHQEILWELIESPEIEEAISLRNYSLLKPFLHKLQPDGILVIGRSILGMAKIPDERLSQVFDKHLQRKGNRERALDDAIHLVNALDGKSALVSCDGQVRSTALSESVSLVCLLDFLEKNGWYREDLPHCRKCRKLRI